MATKVQVKIDASKIRGAFRCNIQGRTAVKDCVCIPVERLYHGKDGALYIDFVGYEDERRSYGRLYSLKQTVDQQEYNRIKENGEQIPFCGDIKLLKQQAQSEQQQ